MRFTIIIFLLLVFIFSCENMETVVDLEVPETPEVLVLNGVLDTDTNVRVFVSHSIGAFSNQTPISINNANVKLFQDDILLENLSVNLDNTMFYYFFNSGLYDSIPINYYEGNLVPEKSTNYRVEVSHDNYPTISASTYIPDDINVYNIDVDTLSNEDKIGFNFSFIDKPNVANYYRLKLFSSCSKEWEKDGEIETYTFNGYVEMMSNDPSFPSTGLPWSGYSFEGNKVIFSDALFNGEEKNIRLDIDTDGFRYQNCDTIRLQFSVFSADTYSYYNSLNDHREEGLLNIFGGEVVPVYSNVQNGLGALISTNAQIIQIKP